MMTHFLNQTFWHHTELEQQSKHFRYANLGRITTESIFKWVRARWCFVCP